jgi:hypothetical protein
MGSCGLLVASPAPSRAPWREGGPSLSPWRRSRRHAPDKAPIASAHKEVVHMSYAKFRPASILAGAFCALVLLAATAANADAAASCNGLISATLPLPADASSLTIDSAVLVAATPDLPEHCQVNGHLDTEINFLMRLPTVWNRKVLMSGNSGFAGGFDTLNPALEDGLVRQYAVVGTDTGHDEGATGGAEALLDRPDRIANLQYRSVHLVALTAKEIVRAYYGGGPRHSYFEGCSRGGIQAMKEVQQYPDDFDGVIAGAPGFSSGGFRLWNSRALFPAGPSDGVLPPDKVSLLSSLVLKMCDRLDGVVDGIVDDPRRCAFSPKANLPRCKGDVDGPNCFTSPQVTALEKIHQGPRSHGKLLGTPFYFSGVEGFSYGDTGLGVGFLDFSYYDSGFPGFPDLYPDLFDIGIPSFAYWLESEALQNIVFSDPSYLLQNFDYENPADVAAYTNALAPQWASSPNLSKFKRRGGKLIEWHGWGDPNINPMGTVDFYNAGASALGGVGNLRTFDRLFMVPGTSHCGGGPGPWDFDPLSTLEQWVEQDKAPEFIVGTNPDTNLGRPICAYPDVARLKSPSLDPTQASSFACVKDKD